MLFILASLVVSSAAAADHPDATAPAAQEAPASDAIVKQVQDKYADVATMKASFVQTTKNELFGSEEQAGTVVLERPHKMRWDFPGKLFVTDGSKMWVYTEADAQVLVFDDVKPQADAAQSLLQSLDRLEELFEVTVVEGQGDLHTFELAPRQEGQVKAVRLVLDADLVVQHVTITDTYDGVTELAFSNVQFNVDVPDDAFEFTPPEGVEVISAGGM